jgi:antitoxin (DNA-binding transcriptional repressor) of toxin-antitoxin stability system
MKSVQLSALGPLADDVRKGDEIDVVDGDTVIAKIVPMRTQTMEERMEQLVAEGTVRPGTGTLPDSFFTDRPPKFESGSVLEQLLSDRRSKDY